MKSLSSYKGKTARGGALVSSKLPQQPVALAMSPYVELAGILIETRSEKAYLVNTAEINDEPNTVWLPKSQIRAKDLVSVDAEGNEYYLFYIPKWLADTKDVLVRTLGKDEGATIIKQLKFNEEKKEEEGIGTQTTLPVFDSEVPLNSEGEDQ